MSERQASAEIEPRLLRDPCARVAASMKIEVSCLLEGWVDRDPDLERLSPRELARQVYLRLIAVASAA